MNKKIYLFAMLLFALVSMQAQQLMVLGSKAITPIKGGSEGKSYAFITKTNLSKQALVDSTTLFLSNYGLIDRNEVNLDEIDENTSEITIPFILRQTIFINSAVMGIKIPVPPVKLNAELRFEFHEGGGAMVVIQNMYEEILQFTQNGVWEKPKEDNAAYQKYLGEQTMAMNSKTIIGKALIFSHVGLSGYKAAVQRINDYFQDIDNKYDVYYELVRDNVAKWCTDDEYLALAENSKFINKKQELSRYKAALDKGGMLAIGQKRWEDAIRTCFDGLFKTINTVVGGQIQGVAEDGEQTWTRINDLVVPTDPKQQKKYLKEKKSY